MIRSGEAVIFVTNGYVRDDSIFPNATKMVPEHWLDAAGRRIADPYTVLRSFGGGQRQCIGMRFAEQEIIVVLALLLRSYHLTIEAGTAADRDFLETSLATTLKDDSYWLIMTHRHALKLHIVTIITTSSAAKT